MEYSKFIGFPIEYVKNELDKLSVEYNIIESSNIQKNYDTQLVVRVRQISNNKIELTIDKFMLDIQEN